MRSRPPKGILVVFLVAIGVALVLVYALHSSSSISLSKEQSVIWTMNDGPRVHRPNNVNRARKVPVSMPNTSLFQRMGNATSIGDWISRMGNSKAWLTSQRLGNAFEVPTSEIDKRQQHRTVLEAHQRALDSILVWQRNDAHEEALSYRSILQDSLCPKTSPFLQGSLSSSNNTVAEATRLVYLAMHAHQHRPALAEARHRMEWLQSDPTSYLDYATNYSIAPMDFECPNTKFLVISMGRLGLGAVVRLGLVNGLIAGMATNRTVVVLNQSPVGPKFLRHAWPLASCPRQDLQCFFLPITPCVLTHGDVAKAKLLDRGEARRVFKFGELAKRVQDAKVVAMDIVLRPQRMPETFLPNLHHTILESIILSYRDAPDDSFGGHRSQATVSRLLLEGHAAPSLNNGSTYYYFGHDSIPHYALAMYGLRPNYKAQGRLQTILKANLPTGTSFVPQHTVGLPIRASDKCIKESECLSFDQYMALAEQEIMPRRWPNASLVVTSESPSILQAQRQWRATTNLSFSLAHMLHNSFDKAQGTGNPHGMLHKGNVTTTMDDIMLSAISSLQLQLHVHASYGNCCSNFHLLLFDFLKGGCAAVEDVQAHCLQDNANPTFRLCCEWSKTEECLMKKTNVSTGK